MSSNSIRPSSRQKTIGVFSRVSFPSLSEKTFIAKADTGAYSGAIHCSKIIEEETSKGTVLTFYPFEQSEPVTYEEFAVRYVKSSNGQRDKRYFIETEIELEGEIFPIVLSLADRSNMKWQVLIGRKFLKQHGFVVDVRRPSQYGKVEKAS